MLCCQEALDEHVVPRAPGSAERDGPARAVVEIACRDAHVARKRASSAARVARRRLAPRIRAGIDRVARKDLEGTRDALILIAHLGVELPVGLQEHHCARGERPGLEKPIEVGDVVDLDVRVDLLDVRNVGAGVNA